MSAIQRPAMKPIPISLAKALGLVATIAILLNAQADSSTLRILSERELPDSCHLRELELCSMGLLSIFQNQNGLPVKEAELKRQCEFFNESVQCFDKYSHNCLTDQQFGVADLFMRNPVHLVDDFCRKDSELRKNYTKHVDCFREIQRKYQRTCLTDFQAGFEGIHKMNASLRLTTACCNMNRLKECLFAPIDYECGISATETVERLLTTISGTWFTLPCRSYDTQNPQCKTLLPKIGTKPHTGRNTSALSRVVSGFTNVPAQM